MDLKALQDYTNWVGRTSEEVLYSVKTEGGWAKVFPGKLPKWAHRVRNYFNVEPMHLTRLNKDLTRKHMAKISSDLDTLQRASVRKGWKSMGFRGLPEAPPGTPDPSFFDRVAEDNALYRYVYEDELGNIWYQMDSGGTIYHYGGDPWWPTGEGIYKYLDGQADTPVFKLVAPDDTGGSMETIIKNIQNRWAGIRMTGRWSIEEPGKTKHVAGLIITNSWHQGSYNYSETVIRGIAAHRKRDVSPHEKYTNKGIYVNPPDRFMHTSERLFPEKADGENEPLASQI
jgi:hypothetical protein